MILEIFPLQGFLGRKRWKQGKRGLQWGGSLVFSSSSLSSLAVPPKLRKFDRVPRSRLPRHPTYGYDAFQLQKLSFAIEKGEIVDLIIPDNGFIKGEKLEEFVNKTVKNTPMEKLKIPFYAVAADIQSGQEVAFGRGNTGMAVRASCSIPGIFRPVKIGERVYVDGGVVSPVAVDVAKQFGADIVIAVDISAGADRTLPENTIETILRSYDIMYSKLASIQILKADVVIKPKVSHIGSGDFSKRHEAILEGERAAIETLPQVMQIVNRLRLEGRLE